MIVCFRVIYQFHRQSPLQRNHKAMRICDAGLVAARRSPGFHPGCHSGRVRHEIGSGLEERGQDWLPEPRRLKSPRRADTAATRHTNMERTMRGRSGQRQQQRQRQRQQPVAFPASLFSISYRYFHCWGSGKWEADSDPFSWPKSRGCSTLSEKKRILPKIASQVSGLPLTLRINWNLTKMTLLLDHYPLFTRSKLPYPF